MKNLIKTTITAMAIGISMGAAANESGFVDSGYAGSNFGLNEGVAVQSAALLSGSESGFVETGYAGSSFGIDDNASNLSIAEINRLNRENPAAAGQSANLAGSFHENCVSVSVDASCGIYQ